VKDLIKVKLEEGNITPVLASLKRKGFPSIFEEEGAVMIRESDDIRRLDLARRTGTDRDDTSRVWAYKEKISEIRLSPSQITYVQPIWGEMFGERMLNVVPGWFYLLYDSSKLMPVKYEGKSLGWDIRTSKEGFTFLDALILVVEAERIVQF